MISNEYFQVEKCVWEEKTEARTGEHGVVNKTHQRGRFDAKRSFFQRHVINAIFDDSARLL